MSKTIFTAGYGNQKPVDFLKRLKDAGVGIVVDVRRSGSRGRLRCYDMCGRGMGELVRSVGICYAEAGMSFGNRSCSLVEYLAWLGEAEQLMKLFGWSKLVRWWALNGYAPAILCAERDAYKYDAEAWKCRGKVNCHRAYVADALVKLLGDGWRVIHL